MKNTRVRVTPVTPTQSVELCSIRIKEYYNGVETGEMVWRTTAICDGQQPFQSVLGRGDTRHLAEQDWVQRARDDGHKVEVIK